MGKEYAWELRYHQREFSPPLSRNIFGLFTVPVYINHVRAVFVMDTGAQINGIKSEKVAQLRLKKTGGKLQIGSIDRTRWDIQGLVMGSAQLEGLEVLDMAMIALGSLDFSLRFGSIDLLGFGGIFGWDILHQLGFELDDIVRQFIVLGNRLRIPYPNMLKESFPCSLVKRADREISLFGFDNGSRISWIGEQAIQECTLAVVHKGSAMGFGVHGLERMGLKIIKQWMLYLDKVEITLKDTMTGRVRPFDDFAFDGASGDKIFRKRRMRTLNSANMVLLA